MWQQRETKTKTEGGEDEEGQKVESEGVFSQQSKKEDKYEEKGPTGKENVNSGNTRGYLAEREREERVKSSFVLGCALSSPLSCVIVHTHTYLARAERKTEKHTPTFSILSVAS